MFYLLASRHNNSYTEFFQRSLHSLIYLAGEASTNSIYLGSKLNCAVLRVSRQFILPCWNNSCLTEGFALLQSNDTNKVIYLKFVAFMHIGILVELAEPNAESS